VLHEATLVAIDQLGEELSGRCTRLLRERGGPTPELRAGLAELSGLIDVLDTIDYSGGR
jgi:hypothetical protein